jgi:hypothetical protein
MLKKPRVEKISRFGELFEISICSKTRKLWYNPIFNFSSLTLVVDLQAVQNKLKKEKFWSCYTIGYHSIKKIFWKQPL